MVLALCSGIEHEVHWALDRLLRLSNNTTEPLLLKSRPGLLDALFEWPEWYATEGHKYYSDTTMLFIVPEQLRHKRRHAQISLLILRNSTLVEENISDIQYHTHTIPFIVNALYNVDPTIDENAEFILHTIDLLHGIAGRFAVNSNWDLRHVLYPLQRIVSASNNRSIIISALSTITVFLSFPHHQGYLSQDSPVLTTCIKYLPLFVDKILIDACLGYLYVHLSSLPMAKAFLLHPSMPAVLKLLVNLLIAEQRDERVEQEIGPPPYTTNANTASLKQHELTKEERETLLPMSEPERCYEW
jgi:chromatin structure-remodeling complex subunit RSC9